MAHGGQSAPNDGCVEGVSASTSQTPNDESPDEKDSVDGATSTFVNSQEDRTDATNTANTSTGDAAVNSPIAVPGQKIDWSIYKSEVERLKTFRNWSVSFIDKEKLAAAGFVYYWGSDGVKCAFCHAEIGHWVRGDDPFQEHKKWSPTCPFVSGFDVGNVPIDESTLPFRPQKNRACDTCGIFGMDAPAPGELMGGLSETMEKLGIAYSSKPLWPEFVTIDSRLKTYENWPISMKQKPETLSEAGFFYTGKGDQTVCFHCGKGLRYWEEHDDPWIQHAVWFPRCGYLVMAKGKSFVDHIQQNKAKLTTAEGQANLGRQMSDISANRKQVEENAIIGSSKESRIHFCKICAERERGLVFLPCGHVIACVECGPSLSVCPDCNTEISAKMRAHIA
ncbi:baculoviral IAP repeat-containing protein 7-like [Schistocerca americana]|uniref:baculoviral IAP repeat-containing protein 7-like n=1 Tax=Schistocerca americana TaxID=7009 RepID=UPI001F4F7818|nr:baculoviral IAP repeat-containing protein 7-like [Schistocerca americana]XP_049953421.1 baculoviral IAP repeat-containing protein 7-like [Schistocerca serialis cubense]